jgi:hypothetical protein
MRQEKTAKDNKKEVQLLRKELKIKQKTLATYEYLMKTPNPNYPQGATKVYPCKLCHNKVPSVS